MNRVLQASIITLLLFGVAAVPASALAGVGELASSTSKSRDDATSSFPAGTTEMYALFAYEDLANHKVGVSLMGFGLTDIVSYVDRYDGTGEAAVHMTGADMYKSLADSLVVQAEAAASNAKKAADQATGRMDYLDSVRAAMYSMGSSLALLEMADAGAEMTGLVLDVTVLVEELDDLVGYAQEQDIDEDEQKARAAALKQPAADLEAAADALSQAAQSVGEVAFPPTGTQSPYTLLVTLSGSPAQSIDVYMLEEGDEGPGAAAGGSTDSGGTPTKTPTASGAGAGSGSTSGQSRSNLAGQAGSGSGTDSSAGADSEGSGGGATGSGVEGQKAGAAATSAAIAATASGRAGNTAAGSSAVGSGAQAAGTQPADESADLGASEGMESAAGGAVGASEPGAEPTWTVPAVAQASGQQSSQPQPISADSDGGSGGSSGPNLAVLGIGAIVLVGVALWLRQRA
ncbi:MAG: hypothetical protein ACK2UL_10220 [Anaerolineae bacterium]